MFGWLTSRVTWSTRKAVESLRRGHVPHRLHANGRLDLSNCPSLIYLPRELQATWVDVSDCSNLRGLPERLTCDELILRRTNVECLTSGLQVKLRLDAQDCRRLQRISGPLRVLWLNLRGCTSLERVPDGITVRRMDLSGCNRLEEISTSVARRVEHLDVSYCANLTTLPEGFERLETLSVAGCTGLESLPDDIKVRSWIDVAGSALHSLPWSVRSARILWRGVPIPDRVAFNPETITVEEILRESNLEMRRILLDRVGIEWFVNQTQAKVVDNDYDSGGERRLLRVLFSNGEDVVCLQVQCPSTGNRYILRVPPHMQTCKQAAAWIAGYSTPESYQPIVET